MASSSSTGSASVRTARVALINLNESASNVLRECFRQFKIDTVSLYEDAPQRLRREKFEACVLPLQEDSTDILEAARTSPSNSRIVVYGISRSLQDALRFSRFGLNAVLDEPVERQNALRAVRSTHLLVLHEFRRYIRLPIVTKVMVATEARQIPASSEEISAGGMSLKLPTRLRIGDSVEVAFDLPKRPGLKVRATACWVHEPAEMLGVRFDVTDDRRLRVREWIDEYLEML